MLCKAVVIIEKQILLISTDLQQVTLSGNLSHKHKTGNKKKKMDSRTREEKEKRNRNKCQEENKKMKFKIKQNKTKTTTVFYFNSCILLWEENVSMVNTALLNKVVSNSRQSDSKEETKNKVKN